MPPASDDSAHSRLALRGKDSDARLAAILMVLLSGGHVNGEELAARFGVAPRTIYRDIDALKRRGLPIMSTVGPGGGYVLQPTGDQAGQLTAEAGFASLLTDTGPLAGVGRAEQDVAAILDRAEAALDHEEKKSLARVRERIFFDTEEWYLRDFTEPHFTVLRDAVLRDRILEVRYRDRTGRSMQDAMHPLGLVWKGGFWYLFVRTSKGNFERIRLERIEHVAETEATFRRPNRPLVELWRDELAQFGVGAVTVRLVISGPATREFEHFNWKKENKITKAADRWDVEMHVDNFDWLIPIALSYAGDVEILEPEELRERVAQAALQIAHRHGSDVFAAAAKEAERLAGKGDIRGRAVRGRTT